MSDWQPGDLALCVKRGTWVCDDAPGRHYGPDIGQVLAVVGVHPEEILYLEFGEFDGLYQASRFRKIKPLTDTERKEALRDLKAPVREPVQ